MLCCFFHNIKKGFFFYSLTHIIVVISRKLICTANCEEYQAVRSPPSLFLVAVLEGSKNHLWGAGRRVRFRSFKHFNIQHATKAINLSVWKHYKKYKYKVTGRTFSLPLIFDSFSLSFVRSFRSSTYYSVLASVSTGVLLFAAAGSKSSVPWLCWITGGGSGCLINSTIRCSWRKAFWRTVPAARSASSTTSCRLGYSWPATAPTVSGTGSDTPALAAAKTSGSRRPGWRTYWRTRRPEYGTVAPGHCRPAGTAPN